MCNLQLSPHLAIIFGCHSQLSFQPYRLNNCLTAQSKDANDSCTLVYFFIVKNMLTADLFKCPIVYFSLKNKIAVLCGRSTIQGNDSPRLINHSPNTNSQISFCHTLTFAVFLCFLFLKYLQYCGTEYEPNGDNPSNYQAGQKASFLHIPSN